MRKTFFVSYEINSLIFLSTCKIFRNFLNCEILVFELFLKVSTTKLFVESKISRKFLESKVKSCYENISKIREF